MRRSDDSTVREFHPRARSGTSRHTAQSSHPPRSMTSSPNSLAVVSNSSSHPEKTSTGTSHAPANPLSTYSSSTGRSSYSMFSRLSRLNNHNRSCFVISGHRTSISDRTRRSASSMSASLDCSNHSAATRSSVQSATHQLNDTAGSSIHAVTSLHREQRFITSQRASIAATNHLSRCPKPRLGSSIPNSSRLSRTLCSGHWPTIPDSVCPMPD